MIKGPMYNLDNVLEIENPVGSRYLLCADRESDYEIYFGKNRKTRVGAECYVVTIAFGTFDLDKVEFKDGVCNYLQVLKDRGISYKIPKSLPASHRRNYTRFQCAIGCTYWSGNIYGFFGKNGFAITERSYIGDDQYQSYEINFSLNPNAFHIGEHAIGTIFGYEIPNSDFIKKLLEEDVHVENGGEPLISMLKEAGISDMNSIQFEVHT